MLEWVPLKSSQNKTRLSFKIFFVHKFYFVFRTIFSIKTSYIVITLQPFNAWCPLKGHIYSKQIRSQRLQIFLTILTGKNLFFTEFSIKIQWNTRLAASDVFHMLTWFTQSSSFNSVIVQISEECDSSNRQ